jgi:hypothetical protein
MSRRQSRQSTHFSFRPDVDNGSEEEEVEEEIEEELVHESRRTTASRGMRNPSNLMSRKTTMSSRGLKSEEEIIGLEEDDDYSDEEFDDEARGERGFEFEDKAISRTRSQPVGRLALEETDTSRQVDTAPGLYRRGSVNIRRMSSEVPHGV